MSAWGLALAAACPDFAGAADPNRVRQQVPDPAFCTLYPLDDETVRRHAGPLTASFHPAARACQHGDWHLLLPVPSLQVPRTRTGSGSKCQTLPVVRASPLDDETVRRHAGPLTASFHPAARACQHGDWHLLLPVPVFAHDAVPNRVRQHVPDPAWCALHRSMTKQCGGTTVSLPERPERGAHAARLHRAQARPAGIETQR